MPKGSLVIRNFDGVDLSVEPRELPDNKLAWSQNTYQSKPGAGLALRPQTKWIREIQGTEPQAGACALTSWSYNGRLFWIVWRPISNGKSMLGYTTDLAGGGGTEIAKHFNIQERPQFVHWRGRLYVFPGADIPGFVFKTMSLIPGGGSEDIVAETEELGASWAEKIRPRVAWLYRGSWMFAGMDSPYDSLIWPSEVGDVDTLLAAAKSFYVSRGDGDQIIGGAEIAVYGGAQAMESYSIVWKKRSTWLVHGDPPTVASNGSIRVVPLFEREGLVAKETIAKTEHGVIWCSGANVWLAAPGERPVPIGEAIVPYIAKLPQDAPHAWHAAYFNGIYRLTVPSEKRIVTGVIQGSARELPPAEQWWCDLREYANPKTPGKVTWWGPMTLPADAMHVQRSHGTERLFALQSAVTGAGVWVQHLLECDVQTSFHRDAYYDGSGGTADPIDYIEPVQIRFKEFDFGDPMLNKLIEVLELHVFVDQWIHLYQLPAGDLVAPWPIGVDFIGDGGDQLKTATVSVSPDLNATFTGLGFNLDSIKLREEHGSYAVYPPNGARFIAKAFQPVVQIVAADAPNDIAIPDFRIRALGVRMRPIGRRPS